MPDSNSSHPSGSPVQNGKEWQEREKLERDLLARIQSPMASGIPRRKVTGPCAASFAQSRLWYMDQLEPGLPLYHMQSGYRIRGPLDVTALERGVNEIVRRHEVLRTSFIAPEGQPMQVIAPERTVPVTLVDFTAVPDAEARVQALAREHVRRPYDLALGPLLRLTLVRLAPEEHVLLLAMHHIISDGWSMSVFAREFSMLYDAFARGQPSPLPPLPIQYADYSLWQRARLQGQQLQAQLDFWREHLAGAPPTLELPTDRARPAQPSYNGLRLRYPLSPPLMEAVRTLAAQQRVTPFMVLLAAFGVVLQRHAGQDDLVIGTPIANRTHVDIEGLIGFFINTLAIRLNLSGNPTFRELLARVRDVALDAYEHQELPFEKLVEELHPERDLSRAPVFQALFQLLNLPETFLHLAGVTLERFPVDGGIAPMDLVVSLNPDGRPPELTADYSTDIFDHATVQRLIVHYQTLLQAAVARPDERIGYLPMLTSLERERTLVEWNRSTLAVTLPQDCCLHQLFEAQVQRTPDAFALIFGQRQYTYREVNARANALAHHLMRQGVGAETKVGLFADYCPEAVVGLLAVLKAGGAYVPLNPEHPPERLAFIVSDTGLRHVLTLRENAHLLPSADLERTDIDLSLPEPLGEAASNLLNTVTPDHLAYIIYTSGSTGLPRGVLVPHRGVANCVLWSVIANGLGPGCRTIGTLSLSFDAATFYLLMPLVCGATSCLASLETVLSPSALLDLMRQNAVTHATTTTSVMAALPSADLPSLRMVNVGGEACPPELIQRWGPQRGFFNFYGPTEASILALAAECNPDGTKPPIGHPLANTQAYILDRHLQPVPVGVTGELYLAGIGVTRGYLNQPDLTAERFVPDPFSAVPGARMYRTGDLARYLPDGSFDFMGRADFQVKVRGFRVEPGEVEAVLRKHPAVHESIVIARRDEPGDVRLIAYAVLHPGQTTTPAELQEHLRRVLPYYMVPSTVLLLDSMPLSNSGKIDRRALPVPSASTTPSRPAFVAPSTTTELQIAGIWKQILNLEQVGAQDNFFDLGGHSLLAMRAIATIEKQVGVRLSPRDFMFQTLAQLAATCDARLPQQPKDKPTQPGRTDIEPRDRGGIRQAIKRLLGKGS